MLKSLNNSGVKQVRRPTSLWQIVKELHDHNALYINISFTQSHTPISGQCHAKHRLAPLEQWGFSFSLRGNFSQWTVGAGIWTANLSIISLQSAVATKPQLHWQHGVPQLWTLLGPLGPGGWRCGGVKTTGLFFFVFAPLYSQSCLRQLKAATLEACQSS